MRAINSKVRPGDNLHEGVVAKRCLSGTQDPVREQLTGPRQLQRGQALIRTARVQPGFYRGYCLFSAFQPRLNELEPVVESGEELAAEVVQHVPNIGIVKVLCIPVQETTLLGLCLVDVPLDRREHNCILERQIPSHLDTRGPPQHLCVQRDDFGDVEQGLCSVLDAFARDLWNRRPDWRFHEMSRRMNEMASTGQSQQAVFEVPI